jgi:hypothetical protein
VTSVVNGYCTVEELRDQASDDGARLDADLLARAVNAASRGIDMYCSGGVKDMGRRFWRDAAVTTRRFRTDDASQVWCLDVSGLTGLVVKTDDDDDGVYETTWTINTDFVMEPLDVDQVAAGDTGVPYAFWMITAVGNRVFPVYLRRPGVQVTAKFGWSTVPDEVHTATIILATKFFKRKDAPFGVAGFSDLGAVRIIQSDPDVKMLLDPYVKQRPRALVFRPQANSMYHQRVPGVFR